MIQFDRKESRHDLDFGWGPQPRAATGDVAPGRGRHGDYSRRQASPRRRLREQGALTQAGAGPAMGLSWAAQGRGKWAGQVEPVQVLTGFRPKSK
jgi:hypothetical protein